MGNTLLSSRPTIEWRASRHRVVLSSSRRSILKSERHRATTVAWHISNPPWGGVGPRGSGASNLPMLVERSLHKPEFLFPFQEEMIRHNFRPMRSSLSLRLHAPVPINYGEAIPPAVIRCNSLHLIKAIQAPHAGRLTENGLRLTIRSPGTVRYFWSILKDAMFTPFLPATMKIRYLVGHATARLSTSPPTALQLAGMASRTFKRKGDADNPA